MRALISACLLGSACRYDGNTKPNSAVQRIARRLEVTAVCPEVAGGLSIPRPPAERQSSLVVTCQGNDVSRQYLAGSRKTLEMARQTGARLAILKAKSPACGRDYIYDGSFSGTLTSGHGVAAQALIEEGLTVVTENIVEYCEPSVEHPVALMLGTGMSEIMSLVKVVRRIPYEDIPGFPVSAFPVEGHTFEALIGDIEGVPVVVYPGRIHMYQGYSDLETCALVRHAHRLGCRTVVLSAAAGSIDPNVVPGTIGLITDHINMTGCNPLAHLNTLSFVDSPFATIAGAYTPYLAELARESAKEEGIHLDEGVFAATMGPTYETEAEAHALGVLGARYIGDSTVCEVIMAAALHMNVLGFTMLTNTSGTTKFTHDEEVDVATAASDDMVKIIVGVLKKLGCAEE